MGRVAAAADRALRWAGQLEVPWRILVALCALAYGVLATPPPAARVPRDLPRIAPPGPALTRAFPAVVSVQCSLGELMGGASDALQLDGAAAVPASSFMLGMSSSSPKTKMPGCSSAWPMRLAHPAPFADFASRQNCCSAAPSSEEADISAAAGYLRESISGGKERARGSGGLWFQRLGARQQRDRALRAAAAEGEPGCNTRTA